GVCSRILIEPSVGFAGRREGLAVRAELDGSLDGAGRGLAASPDREGGGDLRDVQRGGRADANGAGDRLDVQHVPRLAVAGRGIDPQAAPLADGEAVAAIMVA